MTALSTIGTDLTSFQTSAQALNDSSVFGSRSATLSDAGGGWTATAEPNTSAGTYSFYVKQLATQAQLVGSTNTGAALSGTSDVSGITVSTMNISTPVVAGTFTVDGDQITVDSTDTLQDVFDKISQATQGEVTATYNPTANSTTGVAADTITLTDNQNKPIVLGSAADTSNILTALKLFSNGSDTVTSTSALGSTSLSSTIADANLKDAVTDVDSNGNGSFEINGVSIAFNVNTDSLQALMNRVNSSAAGVTMTYNSASDQFTLTNNTTGNVDLSVSEASGGLLQALGLNSTATFDPGTNAEVEVDNGPMVTSTSNTFDQSITGITGLSVTTASTGTQTVTVANDTSDATTAINNFISSYNVVQSFISSQSNSSTSSTGTVTAGTLAGNEDVNALATNLRDLVFTAVPGLSGDIQSLNDIGIGFTGTSPTLSITDSTKLNNALQNDPTAVSNLFNTTGGLVDQINTFVNNANSSTGVIANETNALTADNKSLQGQINSLKAKVSNDQASMTNEYAAMESALSKIQTESQTLNAYFGSNSSSSSTSSSSNSSNSSSSTGSTSSSGSSS